MPLTSAQASQSQLQRYLEQLYSKSPFYQLLQTPSNTKNLLIQSAAARDSTPSPTSIAPPRTAPTTTSVRPQTSPAAMAKLRAALEGNWQAQGMSPYTPQFNTADALERVRSAPEQSTDYKAWLARTNPAYDNLYPDHTNYAIPGGDMSQWIKGAKPTQIGTPNQAVIALEKARDLIESRPHGQSIGKTSYDLDPNLQPQYDPLSDLEAEIRALAGQEDIPGQWISPYSQAYLDQLGNRLGQAGSEAQQQFQGAIGDIVQNYAQSDATRQQYNSGLANELQAAGGNIGIDVSQSARGKQAATDANYLNQVAGTNQATDTSFMTKLGEMANFYGGNLASQAREGLLTPKQWVGPQSGISGGEGALLDFLNNKYNTEVGARQHADDQAFDLMLAQVKAAGGTGSGADGSGLTIGEQADEKWSTDWPELIQAMGAQTDPALKAMLQQYWGRSGTDPDEAGKLLEAALAKNEGAEPKPAFLAQLPEGTRPPLNYMNTANQSMQDKADWLKQQKLIEMAIEFFQKYNPGWNPTLTTRTTQSSSDQKYDPYAPR